MSEIESDQAQRNRARFPAAAAALDMWRAAFGPGVRLVWICENGQEIGRRQPACQGVVPTPEAGPWVDFKRQIGAEFERKFGRAAMDDRDAWLTYLSRESVARFHAAKAKG